MVKMKLRETYNKRKMLNLYWVNTPELGRMSEMEQIHVMGQLKTDGRFCEH